MILIAVLLALVESHPIVESQQLIAPDDFSESDHMKLFTISQLHDIFHDSRGIVDTLPDEAFTCTAEFNANHGCKYARISRDRVPGMSHGWCGKTDVTNEITVDMTTSVMVSGVAIQGRGDSDQWVTSYSIETSEDGYNWKNNGKFKGNFDRDTICESRLDLPVLARHVKLRVLEYHVYPSMRLDVLVYHTDDN